MGEQYALELRGVSRRISSEFYLRGINLTVKPGEVHALVGRNASGKSTLFSTIMGTFPPDSGEIFLDGKPIIIHNTEEAVKNGILLVAQQQRMFDNLAVYENLYFGCELKSGALTNNKKMIAETEKVLQQMNVQINPRAAFGTLSDAERQLAAIARAILSNGKIILLDEPSTHLNEGEKQRLYDAINRLKKEGRAFLIISHDLGEVLATADLISVVQAGEIIRTAPAAAFDRAALIEAVYAVKAEELFRRDPVEAGTELLRVESLTGEGFHAVSLSLQSGQVTALVGGVQSGKLAFARALSGLGKSTGTVYLDGSILDHTSPMNAVRAGIALASSPEDEEELLQNEQLVHAGKLDNASSRFHLAAHRMGESLRHTFGAYVMMKPREEYMTGGNRQRELIERTLRKQARVYLLCEPTAGLDIPARMRLYYQMNTLLQRGAAVLWLTADIDEALGLCDHIAIMRDGQLVLCAPAASLTREQAESAL